MSVVLALLVLAAPRASARLDGSVDENPFAGLIRTEEGRRLQTPLLHEAVAPFGIQLRALHSHRFGEDGLVHVRHPVESPAKLGRKLKNVTLTKRELVRLCWKLNVVAYTTNEEDAKEWLHTEETMKPILAAGDSLFGPNITNYTHEFNAVKAAMNLRQTEVDATGTRKVADVDFDIDTALRKSTGVHALEFEAAGLGVVLTFRGSFSEGDFGNAKLFLYHWVLTRMNSQMKHQWLDLAGLPWSKQQAAAQGSIDPETRTLFSLGIWQGKRGHLKEMASLAEKHGLDKDKVAKSGYWEFTKVIADSVRKAAELNSQPLILTGHSQGGSRAQLVSMYYEKKYNKKYETISFASMGGLCFSRNFIPSEDVDPYIIHDQVTEYVHPLDVWGHLDYDVGKVCTYGKKGLATSKAMKYCEPVFGHSGADLMVAGNMGFFPELDQEFRRCRYQTHAWFTMNIQLFDDEFLFENGTTDGGCVMNEAIPKNDPKQVCPTHFDNYGDGCADERSCRACMVTGSMYGSNCYWCPGQGCYGYMSSLVSKCEPGWVEKEDNITKCDATAGQVVAGKSNRPHALSGIIALVLAYVALR